MNALSRYPTGKKFNPPWMLIGGYRKQMNEGSKRMKKVTQETHCLDLVRKRDWEGYICTLLFPKAARNSAFAVRAFNSELSQVGDSVSGKALGLMRFNFWRQTLDSLFEGHPPNSPVATELFHAVRKHRLSKTWLKRMIAAREDYLDCGFNSIKELEDYADDTNTAQLCLLLQCLGIQDMHCDHVASHIGKAHGIMTVIRATPYHASRNKIYLPLQFLAKHGVSQEELMKGEDSQKIRDLIHDLASQAHVHLEHARSLAERIPRKAMVAFLTTVAMDWYMKNLELADFNVYHPNLQLRNDRLLFSVLYHHFTKKTLTLYTLFPGQKENLEQCL